MKSAEHRISSDEHLSRYLFSSREFDSVSGTVKYSAFLPNPNNGETSVFRTSGLTEPKIWKIGISIGKIRGKPVLARGDLLAGCVTASGLKIDPSPKPSLHANIIGWPDEKSAQKLAAIMLADNANLVLKK